MRKYKNSAFDLPEEFYVLDMSRFHYVVVAGRRTDFRDKTYIIKRERKKADDIDIIHYDNLFDFSNVTIQYPIMYILIFRQNRENKISVSSSF